MGGSADSTVCEDILQGLPRLGLRAAWIKYTYLNEVQVRTRFEREPNLSHPEPNLSTGSVHVQARGDLRLCSGFRFAKLSSN